MASLNMGTSYPFTQEQINEVVEQGRIGNYAYGYFNEKGAFVVKYVGRSDTDLRQRITHGLSEYDENKSLRYERFKFSYANSPQEAYEKECRNYHDFGGDKGWLVNINHPQKPEGDDSTCPICGQ